MSNSIRDRYAVLTTAVDELQLKTPATSTEILLELHEVEQKGGTRGQRAKSFIDQYFSMKKKTAKIYLNEIKDSDGWHQLLHELGLITTDGEGNDTSTPANKELVRKHFQWGEYASLELEIDEDLNVVGGRIL